MTASAKKKRSQDDAASDHTHGGGQHKFDESMWLRDGQGRFAGSVKQNKPFSEQELIELKDYKDGNYQQLNSYLNNPDSVRPTLADELDGQAKTLDSAISKSVLSEDTVVFRGMQHKGLVKHAESIVGKTINPGSFLSTSTSSRVARDFAGIGDGAVVLAIKAKKGHNAVYMDQFESAGSAGENELLFARNSKIRIKGVDRSRNPPVIMGEFE